MFCHVVFLCLVVSVSVCLCVLVCACLRLFVLVCASLCLCVPVRRLTYVQVFEFSTNAMKVNAWICAPATARDLESAQRKSISVRTRKMVNNA